MEPEDKPNELPILKIEFEPPSIRIGRTFDIKLRVLWPTTGETDTTIQGDVYLASDRGTLSPDSVPLQDGVGIVAATISETVPGAVLISGSFEDKRAQAILSIIEEPRDFSGYWMLEFLHSSLVDPEALKILPTLTCRAFSQDDDEVRMLAPYFGGFLVGHAIGSSLIFSSSDPERWLKLTLEPDGNSLSGSFGNAPIVSAEDRYSVRGAKTDVACIPAQVDGLWDFAFVPLTPATPAEQPYFSTNPIEIITGDNDALAFRPQLGAYGNLHNERLFQFDQGWHVAHNLVASTATSFEFTFQYDWGTNELFGRMQCFTHQMLPYESITDEQWAFSATRSP